MPIVDSFLSFFGFAVCHTLPARTLTVGGHYLPLCARCIGIYLGIAGSYVYLLIRRGLRVNALPPLGISFAFAALLLPMAVDGITSYTGLRTTTNDLRFVTGLLAGAALPIFAFPLLAPELVFRPADVPTVRPFGPWYDYLIWAAIVALAAPLALADWAPLYYPAAGIAVLGLCGIFFNLALVIWEMLLEKAGKWGRRPFTFVPAALTVALVFTLLNIFHRVTFAALMKANGGKLPI
jgi:uncharacterized membrane protein